MTRYQCLALILFGIACPSWAQYGPTPSRMAVHAYDSGDFGTCAKIYDQELGRKIWSLPWTEIGAAVCYASAGRAEDALQAIKRAIEHPALDKDHFLPRLQAEPALSLLRSRPDWSEITNAIRDKPSSTSFMGSGLDIPYSRTHPPRVNFPFADRRRREVVLIVWVAPDSTPAQVEVETSSGIRALDKVAIETAWRWKYTAAEFNGKTYGYPVRLPFIF